MASNIHTRCKAAHIGRGRISVASLSVASLSVASLSVASLSVACWYGTVRYCTDELWKKMMYTWCFVVSLIFLSKFGVSARYRFNEDKSEKEALAFLTTCPIVHSFGLEDELQQIVLPESYMDYTYTTTSLSNLSCLSNICHYLQIPDKLFPKTMDIQLNYYGYSEVIRAKGTVEVVNPFASSLNAENYLLIYSLNGILYRPPGDFNHGYLCLIATLSNYNGEEKFKLSERWDLNFLIPKQTVSSVSGNVWSWNINMTILNSTNASEPVLPSVRMTGKEEPSEGLHVFSMDNQVKSSCLPVKKSRIDWVYRVLNWTHPSFNQNPLNLGFPGQEKLLEPEFTFSDRRGRSHYMDDSLAFVIDNEKFDGQNGESNSQNGESNSQNGESNSENGESNSENGVWFRLIPVCREQNSSNFLKPSSRYCRSEGSWFPLENPLSEVPNQSLEKKNDSSSVRIIMRLERGEVHPYRTNRSAEIVYMLEGTYDQHTGTICTVGCAHRTPKSSLEELTTSDSRTVTDCEIRFTGQLPRYYPWPLSYFRPYPKFQVESLRSSEDPLFFEPIKLSSGEYIEEGDARFEMFEFFLVLKVLLESIHLACIMAQIRHIQRNKALISKIPIFPLVSLALGQTLTILFVFKPTKYKENLSSNFSTVEMRIRKEGMDTMPPPVLVLLVSSTVLLGYAVHLLVKTRKEEGFNWNGSTSQPTYKEGEVELQSAKEELLFPLLPTRNPTLDNLGSKRFAEKSYSICVALFLFSLALPLDLSLSEDELFPSLFRNLSLLPNVLEFSLRDLFFLPQVVQMACGERRGGTLHWSFVYGITFVRCFLQFLKTGSYFSFLHEPVNVSLNSAFMGALTCTYYFMFSTY